VREGELEQLGKNTGNALAFDPFYIVIHDPRRKLNPAEIPLVLVNPGSRIQSLRSAPETSCQSARSRLLAPGVGNSSGRVVVTKT
jgi:hypothetical protein